MSWETDQPSWSPGALLGPPPGSGSVPATSLLDRGGRPSPLLRAPSGPDWARRGPERRPPDAGLLPNHCPRGAKPLRGRGRAPPPRSRRRSPHSARVRPLSCALPARAGHSPGDLPPAPTATLLQTLRGLPLHPGGKSHPVPKDRTSSPLILILPETGAKSEKTLLACRPPFLAGQRAPAPAHCGARREVQVGRGWVGDRRPRPVSSWCQVT